MCCEQWKIRLREAEDAYHNLMMGQSARVIVDENGERVEYTAANSRNLYNYIERLKSFIKGGCVEGKGHGPARFLF